MENIRSYNSRPFAALKQVLVPTGPQLLLDFIIAILILLLLNGRAIWHYFTRGISDESQVELGDLINEKLPALHQFLENLSHGRFVQIVFWLFVGCVVYMLIWLIGNFITNIRNDIVADEYLHPKFYNRAGYWGSVVARKGLFACIVVIYLAYIYAAVKLLALLAGLCYQSFLDFQWAQTMATLGGAIIASAITIQILFFLSGLVVNTWRVVYRDL